MPVVRDMKAGVVADVDRGVAELLAQAGAVGRAPAPGARRREPPGLVGLAKAVDKHREPRGRVGERPVQARAVGRDLAAAAADRQLEGEVGVVARQSVADDPVHGPQRDAAGSRIAQRRSSRRGGAGQGASADGDRHPQRRADQSI